MKKVLIIPGNTFVSRNYFSSPMIENLKRNKFNDEIEKSIDPKFFTYLLDNKIKNKKEAFELFQLSKFPKV